jgi:hypothetical protein
MRKYFKYPPESIDVECHSINIKPAEFPTIGEYHLKLMYDLDPEMDIEDPYKQKHN